MAYSNHIEPMSTSTSLISLIKNRDEEGWRCVTDLYGPLIYYWCRKSNMPPEDTADIVQDVFRSVLLRVNDFERDSESGSFRAWLWTITRNKVRDHIKTRRGKGAAAGGSDAYRQLVSQPDFIDSCPGHGDSVAEGTVSRALKKIRSAVKKSTWDAFWRSTVDGIDPAVVAMELGISDSSVWQAKSRVLRRARQLLES